MQLIIKEIREKKKLTQDEVVELSGIKKRVISWWTLAGLFYYFRWIWREKHW